MYIQVTRTQFNKYMKEKEQEKADKYKESKDRRDTIKQRKEVKNELRS